MKAWGMTFGAVSGESAKGTTEKNYFEFFKVGNEYIVTKFQRPYTWTDYQIKGIIKDIEYVIEKDISVGWPSMLIKSTKSSPQHPNTQVYDLGDGQQRVISVALALLAIWHRGMALKETGKITEADTRFLNDIIPNDKLEARLCTISYSEHGIKEIKPVIKFSSNKTDLAFRKLFSPLTQDVLLNIIDAAKDESHPNNRLYSAFNVYFDYFSNKSLDDIEKSYEVLLTRIVLSVLQYEENEDMQRAFSNMNSFGISLSESELIKAEIYGVAQNIDKTGELSESFADYWIENLEKPFWKQVWRTKKNINYLDYCLEQSLNSYNNWSKANTEYEIFRQMNQNNRHMLRDLWRKYLNDSIKTKEDFEEFWVNLKKDFILFERCIGNNTSTENTYKWELNYAYQIIGNSANIPSIISIFMKLDRILSEDELIKAIRILVKYVFYLSLVQEGRTNNLEVTLLGKGSPILNQNASFQEIQDFLEGIVSKQLQWHSEEMIEKKLSSNYYNNSYNAIISEFFVYALNEDRRNKGLYESLFNTRKLSMFVADKSREHILPQSPKKKLDSSEKADYDHHVGMLGNVLILSASSNSAAGNKELSEKKETYKKEGDQAAWGRYVLDFLSDIGDRDDWGYPEIQERSKILAKKFAKILSPTNPSKINPEAVFSDLILTDGFKENDIFFIKLNTNSDLIELILDESGALKKHNSNELILKPRDLGRSILSKIPKTAWRSLLFIKDSSGKLISISDFKKLIHTNKK